jgi:hypothetical protein
VYLSGKSIQELEAKEGLSFLEARKRFLDSRPKTGNQSYASEIRIGASSQTSATSTLSNPTPIITASRETASTQTEEHSDPVVPGKRHAYIGHQRTEWKHTLHTPTNPVTPVTSPLKQNRFPVPGLVREHGRSYLNIQ